MKEPLEYVFFLDRALGNYTFPNRLREAGIRIERHSDHFSPETSDIHWIQVVASKGWYAVSQDRRIYRNPVEKAAVLENGLGYFVLPGGHLKLDVLADNFVTNLPTILRFIQKTDRPFIASIQRPTRAGRPGRVQRLYPAGGFR